MNYTASKPFSPELELKIKTLKESAKSVNLGNLEFSSNLLLAPMSAICNSPFRLLMEELGCGGTVSELISCHGINHGNDKTRQMLRIHESEKNIGIQLFGEDAESMARAATVAEEFNPKFIDINMGCPVRKVVTKGGGSALLKDTKKLGHFFSTIKNSINIPLTIKIRTGWDSETINAHEVINIAKDSGVEFVAIHGRTRTQQYKGQANWELLENIACKSSLPIIGNGDLNTAKKIAERSRITNCDALMIGRGCLRNPFIFLEALKTEQTKSIVFTPKDYLEVIHRLKDYLCEYTDRERTQTVQMKKLIVWFSAGLDNTAQFRNIIFQAKTLEETLRMTEDYFLSLDSAAKDIDFESNFMAGGHG